MKRLITSAVTFFLLTFPAFAQAPSSNCKSIKGDVHVAFSPGEANGSITNAGWLNGPMTTAFPPATVMPTADPTTVTFIGTTTFTTSGGTLITRDVYLVDFVLGRGSAAMRIDGASSTGIFAEAAGVVYLNIKSTTPENGEAELAGSICFAP